MSRGSDEMAHRYSNILDAFLKEISEDNRESGYELGRKALREKFGLLDIVEIYNRAVGTRLGRSSPETMKFMVAAGELLSTVLAPFEMTHRGYQQSTEALQRLNRELMALNREHEAFSFSVSHDLRAPLRRILGFSRAILEDHGRLVDAEVMEHLKRIVSGAERMEQLIEAMLSLARLTRKEMAIESVDLTALAQSLCREFELSSPERQVRFTIAPGIKAKGDRILLQAVLTNLIGNAWKFTSKVKNPAIEFGVRSAAEAPVFFVKDNGAGFDMRYADRLFGVFQRLHPDDQFEGTGVGLATVRRIVERHGGNIWATSEIGKGATFFFTLSDVDKGS